MKKENRKNELVNNQAASQDFWDYLSDKEKAQIEKGLADVDAGKYSNAKNFLKQLISK